MTRPTSPTSSPQIFISYAREDLEQALRLYDDLKNAALNPWLDKKNILLGDIWEYKIKEALKASRYFMPLFSYKAMENQGYIHKEIKYALEIFGEFPPNKIFCIPVRLDDCNIPYLDFAKLHRADLFPTYDYSRWHEGINQIITVIKRDLLQEDVKGVSIKVGYNRPTNIFEKLRLDYHHYSEGLVEQLRQGEFGTFSRVLIDDLIKKLFEHAIGFPSDTANVYSGTTIFLPHEHSDYFSNLLSNHALFLDKFKTTSERFVITSKYALHESYKKNSDKFIGYVNWHIINDVGLWQINPQYSERLMSNINKKDEYRKFNSEILRTESRVTTARC
jgi:TIR domain